MTKMQTGDSERGQGLALKLQVYILHKKFQAS